MNKNSFLSIIAAGCIGASVLSGCKSTSKNIVVFYDNDVHCGVEGYAKLAGLRDAARDTAYSAVVSSGDFLQGGTIGAISSGQYIADIMKRVNYDAVTFGNHEFDYSIPRLQELISQITDNATCVNFTDMEGNRMYKDYVMKKYGKKKIAFVGAVTPTTLKSEAYSFFDKDDKQLYDLAPKTIFTLIQQAADKARKEGADYVIVLSHLGEDKNDMNVDSHIMIQSTTGIDAVLDGHTHSVIPNEVVMNKEGKPVLITQTGTKLNNVGKLIIRKDGKMTSELIPIDKVTVESKVVRQTIDSIKALADDLINKPVCKCDVDLRILDDEGYQMVRKEETNAGDITADAYRIMTGADIAINNGGGIRTECKAGNLTYGDIIGMLPYDNYVSIVDVTGAQLKELLAACTKFLPTRHGDFPQVSGMKFTVNVGKPESITDLMILNKTTNAYEPVVMDKVYNLATTDYCITGGGLQGLLKKNNITKLNICRYNDCLIDYVTKKLNGHIGKEYANPHGDGRITIKY